MRRLLAVALLLALSLPAWAQPAGKLLVLACPVELTGDYQPLTTDQVHTAFEQAVEARAPNVDVAWLDPSDPSAKGLKFGDMLSATAATELGQSAKAGMVTWGSIQFQRTINNVPQTFGSQVYVTEIGLTGTARFRLLDITSGTLFSDRTYPFFSTTRTAAIEDSEAFQKAEDGLAIQFVSQIANHVVKSLQVQLQQQTPKPN